MSSVRDTIYSFVNYFLPNEVIQGITEKDDYETYQTIFNYFVKAIQMAYKAYEEGDAKAFDPNPGDAQCQSRGYLLYQIFPDKQVASAFKGLSSCSERINKLMCSKRTDTQAVFFDTHFSPIQLSADVAYLLGCYVAATVRVPHHQEESGVVVTCTNIGRLSVFAKKINERMEKSHREKMVDHIKEKVCFQSLSYMREAIAKTSLVFAKEQLLLVRMYSEQQVILYSESDKYSRKPFVCQFFALQGVTLRIRDEQMLVAFKSIVKEGKPFYLFYRSQNPGSEVMPVSDDELKQRPAEQPIVVYEGVNKLPSQQELARAIEKIGFTTILLANASGFAPYHSKSTLEDLKDPEAKQTILAYKERAKEIGEVIEFDHIYANTLGKEWPRS